ncbi:MAG TPA: ABC transporter substrate-binding protein [Hyphomicrobiaceae bacterium]|nr:ABC transporter substrate-binding protein [Hyphomicrobiaceae bacterium]
MLMRMEQQTRKPRGSKAACNARIGGARKLGRRRGARGLLGLCLIIATQLAFPAMAASQQAAGAPAVGQRVAIVLARERRDLPPPLSLLDMPAANDATAGAQLAINDNNTTGRFLKQEFSLEVIQAPAGDLLAEVEARAHQGVAFFVLDASAPTLLALADRLKDRNVLLLNAGSNADELRAEGCRRNIVHTAPSRSMLADALAQYLVWKRWRRWFLVLGADADDRAFADAIRRGAKRFGAKIVQERTFSLDPGNRRADGGHEQIQEQIPAFSQNVPDYDVLVVADEAGQFGDYLPYRTWDARPVAGSQGLVPSSWHPALEQWGATQFQNRFVRLANRPMRPLDYNVWVAVRSIGEAATRAKSAAASDVIAYLRSGEFELAAFKGRKLSYRAWNGQLRQPILLGTPKLPVTVSPQPGFLHPTSELDTLGSDKPESPCKAYASP